jgi:hypothetical protein
LKQKGEQLDTDPEQLFNVRYQEYNEYWADEKIILPSLNDIKKILSD